jgi:hypothetical protein
MIIITITKKVNRNKSDSIKIIQTLIFDQILKLQKILGTQSLILNQSTAQLKKLVQTPILNLLHQISRNICMHVDSFLPILHFRQLV